MIGPAGSPRIGLTTYVERAQWGVWHERAALLPVSYVEVVAAAGGLPLLLPPIVPDDVEAAAAVAVAGIDGLVLTGGADVDPNHYGASPHSETDASRTDRDRWSWPSYAPRSTQITPCWRCAGERSS